MKILNFKYNDITLDVNYSAEENTVWLTQKDMATLYNRSKMNISLHIKNILEKCSSNASVVKRDFTTQSDGKTYNVAYYNLDIIKEVGYKINPSLTEYFINWCKEELEKDKYQLLPIQSNIIRFEEDNLSLDVKVLPEEETVYLDQDGLGKLFDTTKPNISMHIKNIYDSGELDERATVKDFLIVQMEGNREVNRLVKMYNLDLIISLGYRVNSKRGIMFRRWATRVLKEYMLKGYAIDEKRVMVSQSNYNNLVTKVDNLESRVNTLEKEKEIYLPKHKYIYENQFYEGIEFVSGLMEAANISLVIIDPYVTIKTLQILGYKKKGVPLIVITSSKNDISNKQYEDFNNNHGPLSMYIDDKIHDRYLIIDDSTYYHIGTSFNYIGNKFTQIDKMEDEEMIEVIKNRRKRIIKVNK